jgi:hypothetical protein
LKNRDLIDLEQFELLLMAIGIKTNNVQVGDYFIEIAGRSNNEISFDQFFQWWTRSARK